MHFQDKSYKPESDQSIIHTQSPWLPPSACLCYNTVTLIHGQIDAKFGCHVLPLSSLQPSWIRPQFQESRLGLEIRVLLFPVGDFGTSFWTGWIQLTAEDVLIWGWLGLTEYQGPCNCIYCPLYKITYLRICQIPQTPFGHNWPQHLARTAL